MPSSHSPLLDRRRLLAATGGAAVVAFGMPSIRGPKGSHLSAAMAQGSSSDVPMYQGNAARTGEMPGPGPDPSKGLEVLWSSELGSPFEFSPAPPVVDGSNLVIGGADGIVRAFNLRDGRQIWQFESGDRYGATPAVSGKVVYVGSRSDDGMAKNYLYALATETGLEKWRFSVPAGVSAPPAVVDGTVFFVSTDGHLYAVDENSGIERWRFDSGTQLLSAPTISQNLALIRIGSMLCAIQTEDGSELWRVKLMGLAPSTQAIRGGIIYSSSGISVRRGAIYAIDTRNGETKWSFGTAAGLGTSPAVSGNGVFCLGGDLVALDADNGTETWRYPVSRSEDSSPSIADGTIYVASNAGDVIAVADSDGQQLWALKVSSDALSSPVVSSGLVFVSSKSGKLYCVG